MLKTLKSKKSGDGSEDRIHHPEMVDVYNVTYAIGEITDFELDKKYHLTDRCKVDIEGKSGEEWIPVFYHCRKHCYDEKVGKVQPNKTLKGGSRAFKVGDKVKVLLEMDKPKWIIAHKEQNDPPYMCLDYFRLTTHLWSRDTAEHYFKGTTEEHEGQNYTPEDYYKNEPLMEKEGIRLFGWREFLTGTVMNFWGDFYVQVGPLFFILSIKSIGLPGPLTGEIKAYTGVWTEDREAELIELGKEAEKTIPLGPFEGLPTQPEYPEKWVFELKKLGDNLNDTFRMTRYPVPRWVYTELSGQSQEEK